MKSLPTGLQAHLDTGATTLCWCWRITRRNGARFGFTDHDRDVIFDGTAFEAATGFTTTDIKSTVGLGVDDLEVESALVSDRLSETALAAGDFDDAAIEIYRVNWSDSSQRVLMRKGSLGEVRRSGRAFTAEVRGLAQYLQQPKGRLFQYGCDAVCGDQRCGVAFTSAVYRGTGAITAVESPRLLSVSGLASFAAGWFTHGLLTITSGPNADRAGEVKRHSLENSIVRLELWQPIATGILPGTTFAVTAGCDKQLATCRTKFANVANYRGFPHMPGNDFLSSPTGPGDLGSTVP